MLKMDEVYEKGYIYKITCVYGKNSGKYYVGSTIKEPEERFLEHINKLEIGKHNKLFQKVWNETGTFHWTFEVLEEFENISLKLLQETIETSYLQFIKKTDKTNTLNKKHYGTGGNGGANKGKKFGPYSEERKAKAGKASGEARRGRKILNRNSPPLAETHKRNISEGVKKYWEEKRKKTKNS